MAFPINGTSNVLHKYYSPLIVPQTFSTTALFPIKPRFSGTTRSSGITRPHAAGWGIPAPWKRFPESLAKTVSHDCVNKRIDTAVCVRQGMREDFEVKQDLTLWEIGHQCEAQVEDMDWQPAQRKQEDHSSNHFGDLLPALSDCWFPAHDWLRRFRIVLK